MSYLDRFATEAIASYLCSLEPAGIQVLLVSVSRRQLALLLCVRLLEQAKVCVIHVLHCLTSNSSHVWRV